MTWSRWASSSDIQSATDVVAFGGLAMRRLFGILLLLLCSVSAAEAQTAPRRVALVLANADYANAGSLSNPPNDASLVARSLRSAGFQTVTIKLNLGVAAFRQAMRDFRAQADGAQVALVYYAGHGIEGSGKNWLIPVDASLNSERDLEDEAISLDRVMDDVRGADLRVVILDACRNNPFGRTWQRGTRAVTRGLGGIDADDILVIYAAAPGQTATDGVGGNSPFAVSLAQHLPRPDLPVQLLGGAVRDDVLRATGGAQRPFISASITGTPFYLNGRTTGAGPSSSSESAEVARLRRENEALQGQLRNPTSAQPPASDSGGGAQSLQWPDLTNKSQRVFAFLDANGESEKRFDFSLSSICHVSLDLPQGLGFGVRYQLLSDRGSEIKRSLQGTQSLSASVDLPPGRYTFVMSAIRNAGSYNANIRASCQR